MFEDKEEVKKAMMELKIFGAGVEDIAGGDDNDILESSEEVACQVILINWYIN